MTRTYPTASPIWCAGCGHYGVQAAIACATQHTGAALHETLVLAGIGCSGTVQNNLGTYGYHSMHGRVLPTAVGASLANPQLTVIAVSGDGDGYAIGAGHLVHGFKRNPNVLYVVMNNGVYGLTKGQDSPTKDVPVAVPDEHPLDAVMLGLSIGGTTFLARGIVTRAEQLNRLMRCGLEHVRAGEGLAFVEVLSPCVTYNDTYPQWMARLYDVDSDPEYRNDDRGRAFGAVCELVQRSRIPVGLIYRGRRPSLQSALVPEITPFHALDIEHAERTRQHLEDVLAGYAA